jgi:hypothetical protein
VEVPAQPQRVYYGVFPGPKGLPLKGHMKKLLATAVGTLSLAVVFAIAQDNTSSVEVTDIRGSKHVVVGFDNGWESGRRVFAGLPFVDANVTPPSSKAMLTLVTVELHTPEGQAKIRKAATERGIEERTLNSFTPCS